MFYCSFVWLWILWFTCTSPSFLHPSISLSLSLPLSPLFLVLSVGADLATQKSKMHNVLSALPRENLCTLHFLAIHLNRVQKEEAYNKMSASNLAIVFWPTLMRPPLVDLADKSKQLGWQLSMARMIEHPDFIPEIL